ncbi:MAG: hypothetical protein B7Y84_08195 [Azorhizobium sp. 32-67-21]|nr:MAG: hypothetical protein B7Y84_08195 [Azorhizobium sp. 32-67-21]
MLISAVSVHPESDMNPEERSLIDGLFDRIKGAAGQPRDADAESLIARRVQDAPYAPYALTQTVLVQEHALQQAHARIQELEEQARRAQEAPAPQSQPTSFLGGLFGGGARGTSVPTTGNRGMPLPQQASGYTAPGFGARPGSYTAPAYPPQQGGYPQQAPSGPWGGQQRGGFGGGGFLQGALATAAGVAGGALLFDGIKSLMADGTGPIADQAAAAIDPANVLPSGGDLGQMADNALGGAGGDSWSAGAQDASATDSGFGDAQVQDASFDDGGWDAGGGDDSSWT